MKKITEMVFSLVPISAYVKSRLERRKIKLQKREQKRQEQRWAEQDSRSIHKDEKVLFVDLGANLGQGYSWFRRYFKASNISFELFEPNPYCVAQLMKLQDVVSGKVKLHPFGVGVKEGSFDFYGLDASEGGCYSQGGSLVRWHNSDRYTASPDRAVKVDVINFSTYLKGKAAEFDKIFVKMDIEGAEVELLEALLKEQTANLISTLYVEFHAQYQSENYSLQTRDREQKILDDLANKTDVNVRIWH